MEQVPSKRILNAIEEPIFVDRYGRRRLAVMSLGVLVAMALTAWLGLMAVGLVAIVVTGAPAPPPGG